MAEDSFVATRSRQAIGPAFPKHPTHAPAAICDGVAVVTRTACDLAPLRAMRDDIAGIWLGDFESGAERWKLLVVAFVSPRTVEPAFLPSALPLTARGRTLRSYTADHHPGLTQPAIPVLPSERLDLWWSGSAQSIALDTLRSMSLATLWDMPAVDLHRSTARRELVAGGSEPGAGVSRVSHAEVPMVGGGIDALDSTNAALQALHERTRLGAIFRQGWRKALGGRFVGDGGDRAGGAQREAGGGNGFEPEPGVLENLAGWVRWHTPLGKGLMAAFGHRLQLVEKLLQSGDVDGALKLALKLGRPDKATGRTRFPARLPAMRSVLDFHIGSGFSMPILGGSTFDSLRQRYSALAETLERQGDHRRAAYVQAQLLGDYGAAVRMLEGGALFLDAAKLALDAKLEPTTYIRLFYQAGERDLALALARRCGCFDALAEDSRTGDAEYHRYVVKAWTDMLVATGQHLRALQVTDALNATDSILIEWRREWLRSALELAGGEAPAAELLVRTVLTARWTAEDLAPEGFGNFPAIKACGVAPFSIALEHLQATMRWDGAHRANDLVAFVHGMARMADPGAIEQGAFWQGPAPVVIDAVARAVLESVSAGLLQRDLGMLTTLLKQAKQDVFATDLSKLRALHAAPAAPQGDWHLPALTARSSPVLCACLLDNGNTVLWREHGLLQLLDRHGAPLWQGRVGDVTALIAVGTGPNVIVVQRPAAVASDTRRLTRFASHLRSFHDIGTIPLLAHHDVTSEQQWLVQIGGEIGALDLLKLCADAPTVEFLWSCKLTEQLRVIAFLHGPRSPSWITRTMQAGRENLLEMWTLTNARDLETRIARPLTSDPEARIIPPADWYWNPVRGGVGLELLSSPLVTLPFVPWSEKAEREAMQIVATRNARSPATDTIQSGDFDRPRVAQASNAHPGQTVLTSARVGKAQARLILNHDAGDVLRCVARLPCHAGRERSQHADAPSNIVLLADPHGRVMRVDLALRSASVW